MGDPSLILNQVYRHEQERADQVYLSQPWRDAKGQPQLTHYTWAQVLDQARRMATHLQRQGLEPGARIAILSKNCAHFFMAELAIWIAGHTTVAIFPTESAATVRFVLDHSGASLLFVGKLDGWDDQRSGVPEGLPCIAFPLAPATGLPGWDAVVAGCDPLPGQPARAGSDLAMLIYTSGSTGQPKGVMHSFERITRATEGMVATLEAQLGRDFESRTLSYLPLAHSFERAWVECASLLSGRSHIFFAESLDTFLADLQRARPNTFISVPRLWLKFQQGVFAKMPEKKLDRLLRIPLLGRVVGRKVLAGLGLDQVKLAGSGSAPIPAELIAWYRRLGLQLIEGYAMTEDFAYSHNATVERSAPGHVGVPLPGVQVRLAPDGEVLVKSPGQLVGYYKRPDLDAECFTDDGFFRTGDLGVQRADGLLKITGRKKELFKTSKGKYVAPAPIENLLNADAVVEMALVSGLGQPAPSALLVLAEHLRGRLGDAQVKADVQAALAQLLARVNADLPEHEKLARLVVAREPWSIENGSLTPTMKIKRSRIEADVASQVEAWYASPGPVVWA